MLIYEILSWNGELTAGNRSDSNLGAPPGSFRDDPTSLANAFTRRGLVKHFWNLPGSEGQPSGPAPPESGTELIPNGTLEPTTASWQAEPVETERPVGLHRPVPFRQ
jgi:hypothetical protein